MKKTLALLSAAIGLATIAPAAAEANGGAFYVGPIGGANWLQTESKHHNGGEVKFDTGYNVGGFVGYHFCFGLNLEAEFIYRFNKLKSVRVFNEEETIRPKGNFHSMSYMVNAIYDVSLPSCWCIPIFPYVGVGIGYAQQELEVGHHHEFKFKKNGFAWQVLAGIGYSVTQNIDVAIDYHFNMGRATRLYNHSLSLAAAYKFNLGGGNCCY